MYVCICIYKQYISNYISTLIYIYIYNYIYIYTYNIYIYYLWYPENSPQNRFLPGKLPPKIEQKIRTINYIINYNGKLILDIFFYLVIMSALHLL